MKNTLQLLTGTSLLSFALAFVPACGDDGGEDTGADPSTSSAGSGSSGPGATTDAPTTSAESDSGPATTDATTTTDPGTTSDGPACEPEPNGTACAEDMCCANENCFLVGPLGGVCSDCNEDADCAETTGFGCNFGNPLTGVAAVCSETGDIGEGCETTEACADGLFCSTLIEVPGILSASTCGECETDADCTDQLCVPRYDIAAIAGNYNCVDPMSIEDDEGCNLMGDGSECLSGNCAPASIMGIPVLGVCSPCNEDEDCDGGTCQLPEITIDGTSLGLASGMCVK